MLKKLLFATFCSIITIHSAYASCLETVLTRLNHSPDNLPILDVAKFQERLDSLNKSNSSIKISTVGRTTRWAIPRIDLPSTQPNAPKILVTSGVHGHEAVAPVAALDLLESWVNDASIRSKFNITMFPLINPDGLHLGTSQTLTKKNLEFIGKDLQNEAKVFVSSTEGENYAMYIDLHGAQLKEGFFVIRPESDESGIAERAVKALSPDLLLRSPDGKYPYELSSSRSEIAAREAARRGEVVVVQKAYDILSPGIAVSQSKATVKNLGMLRKVPHIFTVEYPGQIPVVQRNENMQKLVKALIKESFK